MAHLIEETITITLSRVVKDSVSETPQVVNGELLTTIESVVQELIGNDAITVEVSRK